MKDIEFWIDGTYYREKEENVTVFQKSFEKNLQSEDILVYIETVFLFDNANLLFGKRVSDVFFTNKIVGKRYYIRTYHGKVNKISKQVSTFHYSTEGYYLTKDEKFVFVSCNLTTDPEGNVHVSSGDLTDNKGHYIFSKKHYVRLFETKEDFLDHQKDLKGTKVNSRMSKKLAAVAEVREKVEELQKQYISEATGIPIDSLTKIDGNVTTQGEANIFLASVIDVFKD